MSSPVSLVPLGEISHISKGKKPKSISFDAIDDTYLPYILIESFGGQYNQYTNDRTCVLVCESDIEIVWDGERAGLASKGHEGYLGSTLASVSLKNDSFDSEFVFYTLQEKQKYLRQGAEGTGIPHLSRWVVENLSLYKLPLPEQKKIASILTSVDEVIENTQRQIDKLQDLKKATMNELLTKGISHTEFKDSELGRIPKSWEVVTLEEISEALIDYRGKSPPKSDKGIPLITAKNIRMGFIKMEPKEFIEETSFNQWMVRGIPKFGDIFFTTEAPLGFVAMVPEYKHAVGQRVITISPRREIFDPQFLCYQLQGETFQKQLVDSSTGSTVTGIKQSTLRKILLCVLPLSEQQKIIEMVSSIEIRIDQVSIKLTQTQSLKKSLMQDLLTGKVRVTVN